MKNVTVICCIIVCSFLGLVSCSKHNEPLQPLPPGDTSTTPGGDTIPSPYQPGDTLVLTSDASGNNLTALLYSGGKGISTPDFPAFEALGNAFVGIGTGNRTRSIMKFRLKHIYDSLSPNQPQIKKAILYLYQYRDTSIKDPYTMQQDANNGAELHRVVGYWQDSTITWHTQPALADSSANPLEDVVMIPAIATPLAAGTTDNQEIDVTDMIRVIFATHDNKGFLLKLTNEAGVTGRSFGSFACPDASKRPRLAIYF